MEYRFLGASGLKVPALSFGTATFGGSNNFFKTWGSTQVDEATRLIDICLEAGVNLFDTADIYSDGLAEEVLGKAIAGKHRSDLIISTKSTFTFGNGPNNQGSSRFHILKQIEGSLKRFGNGLH
ncbi:aldo/keto reductase [Chryseobacterium sp. P1-3]|uniref:aldo/keto reductase n=1 Tax=Chryseobacterium sp. (strain P1-3) TaxID=1517683 RepID=UPI000A9A6DDF|nr:aldo/keto reductase [Chryseobacterium sp. P1-3]